MSLSSSLSPLSAAVLAAAEEFDAIAVSSQRRSGPRVRNRSSSSSSSSAAASSPSSPLAHHRSRASPVNSSLPRPPSSSNYKLLTGLAVGVLLVCAFTYGGAACRALYSLAQHVSLTVFTAPATSVSFSCNADNSGNSTSSSCLWRGHVERSLTSVDDWNWTNARGADCVLERNASITLNTSAHTGRFTGYALSTSGGHCTCDSDVLCVACPHWRFAFRWLDARGYVLAKSTQRLYGPSLCVARAKRHFELPFAYEPNGDEPFVRVEVTAQCV